MHGQQSDHAPEAQRDRHEEGQGDTTPPGYSNRKYKVSSDSDSKRWYCIVLGAFGWCATAPTSKGAAAYANTWSP